MAPKQRCAWIQLWIFAVCFPVWLTLALSDQGADGGSWGFNYDRTACMWIALIGTVLVVGVGLGFRRRRDPEEVIADERDKMIRRRSLVVAAAASQVTLVVGCLAVLLVYKRIRTEDVIPLELLVAVVVGAGAVWFLVFCVATLVAYAREG